MPRISVALCTYNGARYLKQQVDSIVTQARLPDEVVASDDGSKDATLDILEDFQRKAPFPVRIVRNEQNLGVAKNFEKCIGLCSGDFIALSDQDDAWYPNKLEVLSGVLQSDERAGYVCSDADLMDQEGRPLKGTLFQRDAFRFFPGTVFPARITLPILLNRNVVWGSAMMFRAWLKEYVLPMSARCVQDYWIALLSCFRSEEGIAIDDRLWRYRLHETQAYGVHPRPWGLIPHLRSRPIDIWSKRAAIFEDVREALDARPGLTSHRKTSDMRLLDEKIAHLVQRDLARRSGGVTRWRTVLAELSTGRYAQFSHSWKSVVRDLLM